MIGLARNVHFITHAAPEEYVEGGVLSPRNVHEARALLLLCGVLLGVGYSPSRITILSAYVGQLLLLRSCLDTAGGAMAEIELSTVDAYQGERS